MSANVFALGDTELKKEYNYTEDEKLEKSKKEEAKENENRLAFFPLVQSNPVLDWAFGLGASYLYNTDKNQTRPSQIRALAAYSTNDSYYAGLVNYGYYKNDTFRMINLLGYAKLNYEWNIPGLSNKAKVDQNALFFFNKFMFKMESISDNFFLGPLLALADSEYGAGNTEGELVKVARSLDRDKILTFGLTLNYDTRDNYYYPYEGQFLESSLAASFDEVYSDEDFVLGNFHYRYYKQLSNKDVIVPAFYFRYSTKDTPTMFKSKLGTMNQLRGFTSGDYYNQYMTNINFEYRKWISELFKIVGFVGVSYLSGDAEVITGDTVEQIPDDFYSSAGLGFRYAIQPKSRVHFRFDYAYTNTDDHAFYVGVGEAF